MSFGELLDRIGVPEQSGAPDPACGMVSFLSKKPESRKVFPPKFPAMGGGLVLFVPLMIQDGALREGSRAVSGKIAAKAGQGPGSVATVLGVVGWASADGVCKGETTDQFEVLSAMAFELLAVPAGFQECRPARQDGRVRENEASAAGLRELDRSPTSPHQAIEFCAVLAIGGLIAPMDFMSAIGDLLPSALWGLTSL